MRWREGKITIRKYTQIYCRTDSVDATFVPVEYTPYSSEAVVVVVVVVAVGAVVDVVVVVVVVVMVVVGV